MVSVKSLRKLRLFASLDEQELEVLARKAADVRLQPGEWLIREGERSDFFVVLEGSLQLTKELMGREVRLSEFRVGDFYGEIAAVFGLVTVSSLRAKTSSRVARFSAAELQRLIQAPTSCGTLLRSTMKSRLDSSAEHAMNLPSARVRLTRSRHGREEDDLLSFLRLNRIPYVLSTSRANPSRLRLDREAGNPGTVCVDGVNLSEPTPRAIAQALEIPTQPKRRTYDVVIVGGGPAGLASAVYGASEGLSVLLVERTAMGGQAGTSSRIENYLGFPHGISGEELSERAVKQANRLGAELILTRYVESVERRLGGTYIVRLDGMDVVCAKTVVVATGVRWRRLDLPGVARLNGKGVFYGAGSLEPSTVVGKKVFIIGGGNSAGQSAVFLSQYAQSVTVLIRGESLAATMSQYLIEQLESKANIKVEARTELVSVRGAWRLNKIRTLRAGERALDRPADLIQVMIGADASTDWLPSELERDQQGFVRTGSDVTNLLFRTSDRKPFILETNFPGLFCAGDVRQGSVKRVSSAAGEGSIAISMVHHFLALRDQ